MNRWTRFFSGLYESILVLMTSVMFLVVGANVFCRYILNNSLGWVDELARFLFIWVSFFGAVLAYNQKEHVGLDFIVEKISHTGARKIVSLIACGLELTVIGFLVYYGWIFAVSATNVSAALYIPMKIIYMVVPVCAAFMLMINLKRIMGKILSLAGKNKDRGTPKEKEAV